MIQRIQSVFFLLAAAFSAILFALPIYRIINSALPQADPAFATEYFIYTPVGFYLSLIILAIMNIVLPVTGLLMFKKRQVQIRMGRIGMLFSLILLSMIVISSGTGLVAANKAIESVPAMGMFMPIGAIIFNLLAARAVKKDEELVKSADRIR